MKIKSVITILLLLGQYVSAQNSKVLKGRIYDITTDEPMSYATISIPFTGTGVISNEFGEFVYHYPENIKNEIIQISFLGYETWLVATDNIDPNTIYRIGMQPKTTEIDEVNIIAEKLPPAKRFVRRAIRAIPENYPHNSFQLFGYYRDYIRNINTNDYNNLTEAAVIIEDAGFNTNDYKNTKIKLEQIRYNPDYVSDTMLNIRYDGSVKYVPNADISKANEIALLLYHNPIRNHSINTFSFVNVLDNSFINNHKFNYKAISENDSVKIYEIGFHSDILLAMENSSRYSAEGSMYIKSDDYTILKFNYRINCETADYSGKLLEVGLEYKKSADEYYLSYLAMNNYFEFTPPEFGVYPHKVEHFYQYRELYINKIVPDVVKLLTNDEIIPKDKMLMNNIIEVVPGFWDNYNFVINEKLVE